MLIGDEEEEEEEEETGRDEVKRGAVEEGKNEWKLLDTECKK